MKCVISPIALTLSLAFVFLPASAHAGSSMAAGKIGVSLNTFGTAIVVPGDRIRPLVTNGGANDLPGPVMPVMLEQVANPSIATPVIRDEQDVSALAPSIAKKSIKDVTPTVAPESLPPTPDASSKGDSNRAVQMAAGLDHFYDGRAPPTRRDDTVVDDFFGAGISDPYRWLENPNSKETKAWVAAQRKYGGSILSSIPERAQIEARLKELSNYERFEAPEKHGRYWIYEHNSGLQEQNVVYRADSPFGPGRILLDPNTLSDDASVTVNQKAFSSDGRFLAYAANRFGSDWIEWRVRDIKTGHDLPGIVRLAQSEGIAWNEDGSGFYYRRYAPPKKGEKYTAIPSPIGLYFHKVGTAQDRDTLICKDGEAEFWTVDDGRFLIIGDAAGMSIKDLRAPRSRPERLLERKDIPGRFIAKVGESFLFLPRKGSPRGRVLAFDRSSAQWTELIPQAAGPDVLENVLVAGDHLICVWIVDGSRVLKSYGLDGHFERQIALPGRGDVAFKSSGFYKFSSPTQPEAIYHYDFKTGKGRLVWRARLAFDPRRFESKEVYFLSKDGTRVPMTIRYKKGLRRNGQNPTYLYGYGGFSLTMPRKFNKMAIAWMERGGIYVEANLRGGGEYGEDWHDAGRQSRKQNVFDDFIAAAEYLIAKKYTSPARLAIGGGSNGGLLVGAVLTQRPDLFGAALPRVGVQDMLRFNLFTSGPGWESDYGTPRTKEGFDTLIKYSPLHNVRPGTRYPAVLVQTGDHDDRVVPSHSHKFTAALQAAQVGPAPIITTIERNVGHGGGDNPMPLSKMITTFTDVWAFLIRALGVRPGG